MQKALFSFPDPVNEVSARLVAAGVALASVATIASATPWLTALIAYGFLARVAAGPTLSPLVFRRTPGWFAIVATCFDNGIEAQGPSVRGRTGPVLQTGQTPEAISIPSNAIQPNAYLRSPGLRAGFFVRGAFRKVRAFW